MGASIERPLKIALVGTSCTGKTSIFEHYKRRFEGDSSVRFVEEAAREYFEGHPKISDRFGVKAQGDIQFIAFEKEAFCYEKHLRLVICDRSVLDAPAYVRSTGDLNGSERLMRIARPWVRTYSHILLCDPVGVEFRGDRVRTEDVDTRDRIHQAFLDLFYENNIPYQLLPGDTLDKRVEQVDELICV